MPTHTVYPVEAPCPHPRVRPDSYPDWYLNVCTCCGARRGSPEWRRRSREAELEAENVEEARLEEEKGDEGASD